MPSPGTDLRLAFRPVCRWSLSKLFTAAVATTALATTVPALPGLSRLATPALAADWSRFRGPNGTGLADSSAPLPTKFSATENLRWKAPLPGPGSSSPIVVKDQVFVTCWSGYANSRDDLGDIKSLRRHLVCLDRATGKVLWDKSVPATGPEETYRGMFAENGYASHTPVSDGERVFAFFGKSGVVAYDLAGNQLWQTPVGQESDRKGWGSAASPVVFENLVIVPATAESEALVALDKQTGKEVWRKEARGFAGTWGTPVLIRIDDSRTDLVLGVPNEIWGFDPATGKLRWFSEAMDTDSFCSSVATDGKLIYAVEGRAGGSIALRPGGQGDVTASHVVWKGRHNSRITTPLLHDGRLYFISRGIANCLDAATGEKVYQSRLGSGEAVASTDGANEGGNRPRGGGGARGGRGGQDYSSPVAGDGKLFYVSRGGDIHVLALGGEFKQLATNRVTDEVEDFSGTPAIADGQLLIRSSKFLYCVQAGPAK